MKGALGAEKVSPPELGFSLFKFLLDHKTLDFRERTYISGYCIGSSMSSNPTYSSPGYHTP